MVMLLSFALTSLLVLYLFWKIAKANNLLDGLSYRQMKQRSIVEGQTRLTWTIVPRLWRRLLCALSILVLFSIWCYLAIGKPPGTRRWVFLLYVPMAVLLLLFDQHKPRFYRLTDEGIWVKPAGIFSDPRISRISERRYLRWREIRRVEFRPDRMIFYPHLPEGRGPYRLPPPVLNLIKRVEIPVPRNEPQIREDIEQLTADATSKMGGT
jgi:hypothetical protein